MILPNFAKKLHEIEKMLGRGGEGARTGGAPLNPPLAEEGRGCGGGGSNMKSVPLSSAGNCLYKPGGMPSSAPLSPLLFNLFFCLPLANENFSS